VPAGRSMPRIAAMRPFCPQRDTVTMRPDWGSLGALVSGVGILPPTYSYKEIAVKEKFSPAEWELLKLLPFHIFVMVAGADRKIDEKEIAQLNEDLKTAPYYKDPLHRELFLDILASDVNALAQEAMDPSKLLQRANQIKAILKEKLTLDEYQRFVASIFVNGLQIARASGGGFLGRGDKVSEEEKLALAAFAAMFELAPDSLSRFFG
jgi:hypothetical protein